MISACACLGRIGTDPYCPCEMESRGLEVTITESHISPSVFALLPREDKITINNLKLKALGLFLEKGAE